MLQRPCCRVCVQQINICMRHRSLPYQRSSWSKVSIRSTKVGTKTVFPGEAARPLAEMFPTASKQRHHDNLNLHSGKDQCSCCRLVMRIQNSASPFFSVCTLEQKQVNSSKRRGLKNSDSSSTVVDLKGHFTKQRYVTKYQQPLHIGTQSRTLFAPFDAI